MSEVQGAVLDAESAEVPVEGKITVTVTDNTVRYDSNMSVPETVFWLEIAKNMSIEKAMTGGKE